MSAYFQPEELCFVLDQLINDPHTEEARSKRFRETYSPFNPNEPRGGGKREAKKRKKTEVPHAASKATLQPSTMTAQEPSNHYPVGEGSTGGTPALVAYVEQTGRISNSERIKHWRGSSCQWPFPNVPMAEEAHYAASVDQLEILTEIAASCSGSMNGDCIHANDDIEIHGTRVSPAPQQPETNPPAKQAKEGRGAQTQKLLGSIFTFDCAGQNEHKRSVPKQSGQDNQQPNVKGINLGKRRRSARIAALKKAAK